MEKSYNVEVLYLDKTTGLFRIVSSYRFTSGAATVNGLKDIVRRDIREMGYCPDAILIKDVNTGNSCVINCRKSNH
jgi:hypothetical protein